SRSENPVSSFFFKVNEKKSKKISRYSSTYSHGFIQMLLITERGRFSITASTEFVKLMVLSKIQPVNVENASRGSRAKSSPEYIIATVGRIMKRLLSRK